MVAKAVRKKLTKPGELTDEQKRNIRVYSIQVATGSTASGNVADMLRGAKMIEDYLRLGTVPQASVSEFPAGPKVAAPPF